MASVHPKRLGDISSMAQDPFRIGMGTTPTLGVNSALVRHSPDWRMFKPGKQQNRVKMSMAAVTAFIVLGWPTIIYYSGIEGWVNLWLIPWLVFHFWMSTYTMVHHSSPHIPYKAEKEWNEAQAQLGGTVQCDFPLWVEILDTTSAGTICNTSPNRYRATICRWPPSL